MVTQDRIDAIRYDVIPPQKLLIDGTWQEGAGEPINVHSPLNGEVITTIQSAGNNDVLRAEKSARTAFEDGRWSRMEIPARKRILLKLADLIGRESLSLSVLGVRDNGTEIGMALGAEAGSAAATFKYYAEAIDKVGGEIAPSPSDVLALVHKEPVGVVGAIVPWNFPLMIGAWKLAPALAVGNSVILKPSENASLTLLRLAALAQEAGVPDGVINVVTGPGRTVGESMANSMAIDVLAFTGSGQVGRRLLECAGKSNLKRVYLELGGKSPNIVFKDAPDIGAAAKACAFAIFRNSGQVCVAGSRLLVEDQIYDEFVAEVSRHAAAIKVGNPLDLVSDVGAVNSLPQLESNMRHVAAAESEGAECVIGGKRILENTGGYYMEPTVFKNVEPWHSVAREEVFGPVLSAMRFKSEAEAVQIANATEYGLAAAVWTSDLSPRPSNGPPNSSGCCICQYLWWCGRYSPVGWPPPIGKRI